jgi:type 1 glutamine amidotransferase
MFLMISLNNCTDKPKINTLIITGGHGFERDAFFGMFDSFSDITYKEIQQPQANDIYAAEEIESVDVLIFYDMVQEISEEQKQDFIQMLGKGKNLLFLHHSLASYQSWDEFLDILGGRYFIKKEEGDTSNSPESVYQHDVDLSVNIANKSHTITQGLTDFIIHDETYDKYLVSPDVYPLLTTNQENSGDILGWVNHYKNSWIVYLQLGHDHYAYENPNYRQLVHNSIKWLAHPDLK